MDKALTDYIQLAKEEDFTKILTNPILDIAARFWEPDRYEAFKICYRSMRILDDLVDNPKAAALKLSPEEKKQLDNLIQQWVAALVTQNPYDNLQEKLLKTMSKFAIPTWPWERLSNAMRYDLYHDGFPTLLTFSRYCEGAAIAPASVFMHLCGITKQKNTFLPPQFDIRKEARPLALFSYYVHIIRDVEKDISDNLIYFSKDMLRLYDIPKDKNYWVSQPANPDNNFRQLIRHYVQFANYYRKTARFQLNELGPQLEPRYHLSLELIYALYKQIFDKIDPEQGSFLQSALLPPTDEIQIVIQQTVTSINRKI